TGYSNFWKFLGKRYSWLMKKTVTLREFEPGSHCEVDWAGSRIPWWDHRGQRREAHVFLGILCHSQLIFVWAAADERKHNWITAHQKMYSFFGGVPRVTVPDNLKSGVSKAHLYDPELNPGYSEMGRHYHTAIVPARVRRPKDKALVENAVGLVTRLFRWTYRNHRLHSLVEVNEALLAVCERINSKAHTRFKTSRRERFEAPRHSRSHTFARCQSNPLKTLSGERQGFTLIARSPSSLQLTLCRTSIGARRFG
ncbi:MAG: IS21 family transposase, partial [Betaproteobacteria bacterium]|nr:IS21 family transposase [Betaproteobacteria bacterium]